MLICEETMHFFGEVVSKMALETLNMIMTLHTRLTTRQWTSDRQANAVTEFFKARLLCVPILVLSFPSRAF